MEDLWNLFCGRCKNSGNSSELCIHKLVLNTYSSSCLNHIFMVFFDLMLLALVLFNYYYKYSTQKLELQASHKEKSTLQIFSGVFNGSLGLVYIGLGVWILLEKSRNDHLISPIHWWILFIVHGVTWVSLGLTTIQKSGDFLQKKPFKTLSTLAFSFSGIFCFLDLFATLVNHERLTIKVALDILSFLGANFLLLCTYKGCNTECLAGNRNKSLYTPLNIEENDKNTRITPFSQAGFFSKMTFSWLNPLLKVGKRKTLKEDDIPKLQEIDESKSCYLQFLDQLNKQKQTNEFISKSSIFWAIIHCHRNEILISGLFALLKVIALSTGPILLNSFIKVVESQEVHKYEGFLLAISFFLLKILESLSQRQWYFRSNLIGLKVKSMLTSTIYRKQLRLSSLGKRIHSSGEIMNYATVDVYRLGEFPLWLHQTWTTILQLCFALIIMIRSIGFATIASLLVIFLMVLCNAPIATLQQGYHTKLMASQDERLRACSEVLVKMKVLKLYAWENHFKSLIKSLRKSECKRLSKVQLQKGYNFILYWTSPVLVSAVTFGVCYVLKVPLNASNVFTFLATLRLAQVPIQTLPDVIGVVIQARVAFGRVVKFLTAPELEIEKTRKNGVITSGKGAILMNLANFSWEMNPLKPTLRNVNLDVWRGEKVAICGEVGSGKSTLLAAILGDVPCIEGSVEVCGRIAYVSQTAWIQTGTIRENILFGSSMDEWKYQDTLRVCSLVKDLELLPFGDMTEIGERGVNLSGGQKQRVQLARALYQDADIYLLDDPFSAVDIHTATSLFNEYVMSGLSGKTVLLVTHQVDFLPAFQCCLLMSDGKVLQKGTYNELIASSPEFLNLVTAHKEIVGTKTPSCVGVSTYEKHNNSTNEITKLTNVENQNQVSNEDQLIKQEEREVGNTGFKPYLIYLNQNRGYLYISLLALSNLAFVSGQILQNGWIAFGVDNDHIRKSTLIVIYIVIGFCSIFFLVVRSLSTVTLGMETSKSLFSQLLNSLIRAPMSFYDSTPIGRILTRISSDLTVIDLDIPFSIMTTFGATLVAYSNLLVLAIVTWQVLFVAIPVIYIGIQKQRYYFATAKELMRLNGTTKSKVASHLAESIAGAMTIRAFKKEDIFFAKTLDLIDTNSSPFFHNIAANEWLVQRIETLSATVLGVAALFMVLLPPGTFSSGFIGMALSYGLALNLAMVNSIQFQCTLANYIVSVERIHQYLEIHSEAPEIIKDNRPPDNWPSVGKVEICNLKIKYRPNMPLVLKGISCTFEGGDKIGIVGRTGSGKSTLIGALFRLVEPVEGKIIVDGIDICSIGLEDLRSNFGVIPQDPTLFNGSIRFNLDPLGQYKDEVIWEVLQKCQLKEDVQEKELGLDSLVEEDGSNWSVGQRQLLCLGRALLRRNKVLVLDEATASIDNATDMIIQHTIRRELIDCTVITVAHRIPTVMDCTKVLVLSDGKLVEYDEPMNLMIKKDSLFSQLIVEYGSHGK